MPSSSAMSAACSPPAPPKHSSASSRGSTPRSTVITRSARTISALATRRMPSAHSSGSRLEAVRERLDRGFGGIAVERDVAAQRRPGGQQAEQQVGVGDRRLGAAVAVAGGPGPGARGARAGAQGAARVAPADRAAARADGVDVEHRQRDRAPADLAPGRLAHGAAEDHADVAGGAAHVEAQRVGLARGGRGPGRAGGAARRPGEHGQRGVVARVGGARQPAGGLHHRGLGQPGLARALDEPAQIGAQQRGEGGVDLGRGGALELAESADRLVGERDVHVRQALRQGLADRGLVLRVAVGVQQADRDGLGLRLLDGVDGGAQRILRERLDAARPGPSARVRRRGAPAARAAPGGRRRAGRGRRAPGGRARPRPRSRSWRRAPCARPRPPAARWWRRSSRARTLAPPPRRRRRAPARLARPRARPPTGPRASSATSRSRAGRRRRPPRP